MSLKGYRNLHVLSNHQYQCGGERISDTLPTFPVGKLLSFADFVVFMTVASTLALKADCVDSKDVSRLILFYFLRGLASPLNFPFLSFPPIHPYN